MCIVVDTNVAHKIISSSPDPEYQPVHIELFEKRRIKLALGGQLSEELLRSSVAASLLLQLERIGQAIVYSGDELGFSTDRIRKSGLCVSNDAHVLALVVRSGARVVCTEDRNLHRDLRNQRIVGKRRSIYQTAKHSRLLSRCTPCRH